MISTQKGSRSINLTLLTTVAALAASAFTATQAEAALENDPKFAEILTLSKEIFDEAALRHQALSDSDLDAHLETVTDPLYLQSATPSDFFGATGYDSSRYARMIPLAHDLAQAHGLYAMTKEQKEERILLAMSGQAGQQVLRQMLSDRGIEYGINPIDPNDEDFEDWSTTDDCEALCHANHLRRLASAYATYVAALITAAAAAPTTLFLSLFATIPATVAYIAAIVKSDELHEACLARCNNEPIEQGECDGDINCDDDEFCWKGVMGVGTNECRPLKAEDKTCSRHGQCISGCCKLHIWTHPVSKVCRPANRCN